MSDFTEKFRRVSLFLERVGIVRGSNDVDCVRNQFPFLSFSLRRHQRASHSQGRAGSESLDCGVIGQVAFRDDLQIAQRRAVVQFDERKIFRITPCTHPPLDLNRIDRGSAL